MRYPSSRWRHKIVIEVILRYEWAQTTLLLIMATTTCWSVWEQHKLSRRDNAERVRCVGHIHEDIADLRELIDGVVKKAEAQ